MTNQVTSKFGLHQQPFRALALLLLMLCLLISCPLKRELKSILMPDVAVENPASAAQYPNQIITNITAAEFKLACAKTIHSILDEVETRTLFQHFDFKNPIVFLALSLAALYLLLTGSGGNTILSNAFSGGVFPAKIPLFLRYQQLVI